MCNPMAVMAVAALASTAVSIYGQQQQAKAQERAAEANAQMAANEAATQQQLAQQEIQKGVADRERQQRQAARQMGQMRADMAASGFEIDTGSNLSLLAESAAEHQYDSAVITSNSEQAAWQHLAGATNATNQQNLFDWQKSNIGPAADVASFGTLLGGIGASIGAYNQYKPPGGSGSGNWTPSTVGPFASGYVFPKTR